MVREYKAGVVSLPPITQVTPAREVRYKTAYSAKVLPPNLSFAVVSNAHAP